jgi:predicted ribosome quality control (RQC) complex YloA/Tae2 family protein
MPLDAVCLQAEAEELRARVLDVRIDKVQQPARDQVILLLRGNLRLLLNAGVGSSRIQLTEQLRDNPAEPPMFCMLLRKHLVGGRITALEQPALERLVELQIDMTDEFGRQNRRWLVLETMGRNANLILLDEQRRILECMRRVDAEMSPQRQVLPGLFYERPPSHGRTLFTDAGEEDFRARLSAANPERQLDAFLLEQYFGLSPLIARELAFRTTGATDARICQLNGPGTERFWTEVRALQERIEGRQFTPVCLMRDGKPLDFSYMPIRQYGPAAEQVSYGSFSALMDDFFVTRERQERMRQRGADLLKTASAARDRLRRKLAAQEKDYAATQDRDQLRLCGDLITANLYRMKRGPAAFTTENFYAEGGDAVTIPLDPLLTPQQNAAKYYKRYTKARTAEKHLREQMEIARGELTYLESVLEEIQEAETEQDFQDIRTELRDAGYLRLRSEKKEMKPDVQAPGIPHRRRTTGTGGPQQPPKRPAHREKRRPAGSLAPHPEDPRLPRHSLHRRGGAVAGGSGGGGHAGSLLFPGP